MALLKQFFSILRIDALFGRLVGYGFQFLIRNDPYLYPKLINEYEKQYALDLLSEIGHVGEGVKIKGFLKLSHPRGLIIENNVHIGEGAYFFSRGGITIKDNTHISRNLTIYSANHKYEGDAIPYNSDFVDKPVIIGKSVWIGMNVNILPGVSIGDGAIIGMGTTVSKNVPPMSIVVGSKFRTVAQRDKERFYRLNEKQYFGGVNGRLLSTKDVESFKKPLSDKNKTVFFVLSTGRAGSTTLARILNKVAEVECLHEPKIQLIRISTDLLHNKISAEQAEVELSNLYVDLATSRKPFYGESDQKLANLVPILAKLLPSAKFIWVVRNPEDTVNSTWSRGWFDDAELGLNGNRRDTYPLYRDHFSDYRPQANLIEIMPDQQWNNMTAFERNCWYWTFWNEMIKTNLQKHVKNENFIKIQLENLDSELSRVQQFLGLGEQNLSNKIFNSAETKYPLKNTSDWTEDMKNSFESLIDCALYNNS